MESWYQNSSMPRTLEKYSVSSIAPFTSSMSWSGVQKMWASLRAKDRTRFIPARVPERS